MKKAPHKILLDNDFLSDVKFQCVFAELGEIAIGRYIHLLTRLNDECGRISHKHMSMLGNYIGVLRDDWMKFVDLCVQEELLKLDNGFFFIARLETDALSVADKQRTWRESKRNQRNSGKDNGDVQQGVQEDNSNVPEDNKEQEHEEEQEKEIEKENEEKPDFSAEPPERREKLEKANAMLQPAVGKVKNSNLFISAGRRPMRKWSNIWLNPYELLQIIDELIELGVDPKNQARVFDRAQARATSMIASGKGLGTIHVYGWLTGFELNQTLEKMKASNDLERSETYLTNARVI